MVFLLKKWGFSGLVVQLYFIADIKKLGLPKAILACVWRGVNVKGRQTDSLFFRRCFKKYLVYHIILNK